MRDERKLKYQSGIIETNKCRHTQGIFSITANDQLIYREVTDEQTPSYIMFFNGKHDRKVNRCMSLGTSLMLLWDDAKC